jgi:hypothetical protein
MSFLFKLIKLINHHHPFFLNSNIISILNTIPNPVIETSIIDDNEISSIGYDENIKLKFISYCKQFEIFSNHKLCLYIFYFTTLFPLAPSGNFFGNWLSVIYYIPAGLLIYIRKEK